MSSLITKASKSRSSASKKIRAIKGKKSSSRKPERPGRITAAPKTKKTAIAKKSPQAKKSKQTIALKKPASRLAKKLTPKKRNVRNLAAKNKQSVTASRSKQRVVKAPARKPVA